MIIILACLGLVFGSFVNALIWRLHKQEKFRKHTIRVGHRSRTAQEKGKDLSILTGRSMCTHCGHELAPRDLIPVVSYLGLRGKCRYCGKRIEDTPLAEVLTACLFVASYVWWPHALAPGAASLGEDILFGLWLVCIVGFVALAIYDLRWFLLPDRIVFPLIGVSLVQLAFRVVVLHAGLAAVTAAVWGVLFTAGLFFIIFEVSNGTWIGFGDVKLAIVLGLLVGGPLRALLLVFVASLLGSLIAIPLLLRGRVSARTPLPFGPFLLASTVIVVLFGGYITAWYVGLLH